MRASDRLPYISAMQQLNAILTMLCQHIDIKASIFLSFVAIVLFVYAYGPFGNPVILVLGLGFALAYPIRIGVCMLSSRPLQAGGGDLDLHALFGASEAEDLYSRAKVFGGFLTALLAQAYPTRATPY